MNKLFIFCLLAVIYSGANATNFLQESRIQNIDLCFNDVKGSFHNLVEVIDDLKNLSFKKAFSDLGALLKVLEKSIEKCADATCWMNGQKRCENDKSTQCEKWGFIWYPTCAPGYHKFGCCLCVQDCPEGYRDDGLFCAKSAAYGRGFGYPWKFGDGFNLNGARGRCQNDNAERGCEQWGALIYPKCAANFHNVACCVCSPDCPEGMTDIGVSCTKKTYGRGFGYLSGKCIEENWNGFTPIQKIGKCVDQAKQIGQDIKDIIDSIKPSNDDEKWHTLKLVYTLLQHANPFLVHCIDPLINGISD